jgi:hypothetical protein
MRGTLHLARYDTAGVNPNVVLFESASGEATFTKE